MLRAAPCEGRRASRTSAVAVAASAVTPKKILMMGACRRRSNSSRCVSPELWHRIPCDWLWLTRWQVARASSASTWLARWLKLVTR